MFDPRLGILGMCDVILLCILLIVFACAHVTTSSAAAHHPPLSHQGISYIPSLSKALLDRSRAVIGDESRMHRFISKLVNGQHVKYAVLGSSIATCRGASHIDTGWTAAFHKWLELSFTECGSDLPGFRFFSSDPDYWIRRHLCNKRYRIRRHADKGREANRLECASSMSSHDAAAPCNT